MGLFDKIMGKSSVKLADNPSCDICGLKIKRPDGYFLTTRQVLNTQAYWVYDLTHHGLDFRIEDVGKMLPALADSRAKKTDPWLVCESCSQMFNFDRSLAKKCAINDEAPPGNVPAEAFEAAKIAKEVWTKLCIKKKRGFTAFDGSKNVLNSVSIKDIKWRINNDPDNFKNYDQLEELLLNNGYWFEAKKSYEDRFKTKLTLEELKGTLKRFKFLYCRFYAQCLEERQPFCTKCHTELKYIGNMADDLVKNGNWTIITHVTEEIGETQKMFDTWQGIVCTKCQVAYCPECLENKPRPCPECGKEMYPANLYYLTELGNEMAVFY